MQAYDIIAKHLRQALDNLGEALDVLEDTDLSDTADEVEKMYEHLRVVYRGVRTKNNAVLG